MLEDRVIADSSSLAVMRVLSAAKDDAEADRELSSALNQLADISHTRRVDSHRRVLL